MPGQRFVEISYQEMHDFLSGEGFEQVNISVYKRNIHPQFALQVFTSFYNTLNATKLAPKGRDAIRVFIVHLPTRNRRVINERIRRITTWKERLLKAINLYHIGPLCPTCHIPLLRDYTEKETTFTCINNCNKVFKPLFFSPLETFKPLFFVPGFLEERGK